MVSAGGSESQPPKCGLKIIDFACNVCHCCNRFIDLQTRIFPDSSVSADPLRANRAERVRISSGTMGLRAPKIVPQSRLFLVFLMIWCLLASSVRNGVPAYHRHMIAREKAFDVCMGHFFAAGNDFGAMRWKVSFWPISCCGFWCSVPPKKKWFRWAKVLRAKVWSKYILRLKFSWTLV